MTNKTTAELLAELPPAELKEFLRRRSTDEAERVSQFLEQRDCIHQTRIAINSRRNGSRFGMATSRRNSDGRAVAALIFVGTEAEILPRADDLAALLRARGRIRSPQAARTRSDLTSNGEANGSGRRWVDQYGGPWLHWFGRTYSVSALHRWYRTVPLSCG